MFAEALPVRELEPTRELDVKFRDPDVDSANGHRSRLGRNICDGDVTSIHHDPSAYAQVRAGQ